MNTQREQVSGSLRLGFDGQTCLECGASMRETLRWQQGEVLFTWFECTRGNCASKFLRRVHMGAMVPALAPVRRITAEAMQR